MAQTEVTGLTEDELASKEGAYYHTPKWQDDGIPFDVAFCLTEIGKQPEDYEGPTRYCEQRVTRPDEGGHADSCRFHGGHNPGNPETLEEQGLANLRHGMYAEDENLRADFSEDDQQLYDSILAWADIYEFPGREDDPALYELLEMYAMEKVRSVRSFEYLYENGEAVAVPEYGPDGAIVGERDQENTLSEAHRLQQKLLVDILKEMGLTPKAKNKMDALDSTASAGEQLAEVAAAAITDSDKEYDPDEFSEDD
jgi:hypothetical protein